MFSNTEVSVTRYSTCHDPLHRCIIITVSNQSTTN